MAGRRLDRETPESPACSPARARPPHKRESRDPLVAPPKPFIEVEAAVLGMPALAGLPLDIDDAARRMTALQRRRVTSDAVSHELLPDRRQCVSIAFILS